MKRGERSAKFLTAYAGVLKRQMKTKKFQEVADYYLKHIDSTDLYLPRSWEILWNKGKGTTVNGSVLFITIEMN